MSIQIHGKQYVTVAERLQMVHASGKIFEIVATEPMQAGERWVWRVTVKIDGLEYRGSAEVHLNAKPGSADATDPWACAETSAVGRALGFANFGAIESIASADEIVRSQSRQDGQETARAANELSGKLKELKVRAMALGIDDKAKWQTLLTNLDIEQVRGQSELDMIDAYLTQEAERREKTAF